MTQTSWPPPSATCPKTPMVDQIEKQTRDMKLLYRFLDWLAAHRELSLCQPHQHSPLCRDAGQAIECGIRPGALHPMTAADSLGIPERFLGIDRDQERREREALSEWMQKDRPGGRTA